MKLQQLAILISVEPPDDSNTSFGVFAESFTPFQYVVASAGDCRINALCNMQEAVLLSLEDNPLTQEQVDQIYTDVTTSQSQDTELHWYSVFTEDNVVIPTLSDDIIQAHKTLLFSRRMHELKMQLAEKYIRDYALDVIR